MSRPRLAGMGIVLVVLVSMLAMPASSWAGGPGVWTKLATIDNTADTAGMLRTANGTLHLVWLKKRASNGTQSYGTGAISLAGKLVATGTAISGWTSLEQDPQLVPAVGGMRLVFEGNTGHTGCYSIGLVYTATSANGSTWSLVKNSSMSSDSVGIGGLAATAELNGTPVAAFGEFSFFHVGVSSACPASTPDGHVPVAKGNTPANWAIATDTHNGSVWAATWQTFAKSGYFIDRILPTEGPLIEAPHSAPTQSQFNQPIEPVALAARVGGGIYMAYCVASSSQQCAHIDLWRVGSPAVTVVPGSQNINGHRVAIAAGSQGRIWVAWYDVTKNVIHVVRTNTTGTRFAPVRTINPPSHTSYLNAIQADGSSGRLDIVVNDALSTGPTALFQSQVESGLSLAAKPTSFSHKHKATVVFTVTDAGQPVAGAGVSCLGKAGKTNASGQVKLAFPKGSPVGHHVCTAARVFYAVGKTTITVT